MNGSDFLTTTTSQARHCGLENPSLYILRFAHKLELGDKTHVVSETASRLVQRMKRDWLATGRRPSGLCGAALLVSARMHNFCRTTKDIIKIVKVCETTLKKRLTEFGETPSSHLTLDEFMTIDLSEEQDPPAFKAARLKAKLSVLEQQNPKDVDDEIGELQREIEKALQEKRCRGRYAKYMQADTVDAPEEVQDEDGAVQQFLQEETIDSINAFLHGGGVNADPNAGPSGDGGVNKAVLRGLRPTPESLGLRQSIEECMRIPPKEPEPEDDGHLDLTGIDDDEIDCYIMNEYEAKIKTDMWNELNAEYLKEMKVKEERLAREKEENAGKPEKKKRKVTKKQHGPASTAGEAIEKMLQEKRISNKINYEVLWNLNDNSNKESTSDVPKKPIPQLQNTPLADRFSAIFKHNFESIEEDNDEVEENETEIVTNDDLDDQDELENDKEYEEAEEEEELEMSAAAKLLRQIDGVDAEDAYGYDDYDYDCDDS
uniref:Cyclin-like domain-containing protein n=1 Tax=Strigamia maritima TaxID=126957 RepID=T1IIE8_STRMM